MQTAEKGLEETKQQARSIHIKVSAQVYHWPTLKTVLMVEKTIKDADLPLSMEGLKRKLPTKIMDQTLRLILGYLEDKGSILIGVKGIEWIENNNPKFLKMIKETRGRKV